MRDILFRGKWLQNNRWIEGYGVQFRDNAPARLYTDSGFYEVNPASVGQAIGITIDEIEVFEGDLIRFKHKEETAWDIAEIMYFGEMHGLGFYPAFDLNAQYLKHHHFDSNALSHLFESGDYEIELVGPAIDFPEQLPKLVD